MSDMNPPIREDSDETKATTRRTFIKGVAAAGAALAAGAGGCAAPPAGPKAAVTPAGITARREKLRLAYIGTDGIGAHHVIHTSEKIGVDCPCFCDVDTARMGEAGKRFPKAARYQDYREMFDKEQKNFDAVMIGIPDHQHYPATMIAMQLGKHVYTQKPLTHTPWEARKLTEAAQKYKVVTQMGNQGHSMEGWRLVYEWIHSGALGDITEAHSWTDRPIWPQGQDRPAGEDPVPSNLNWDVWLGPAPARPFKNDVYHPFKWRAWWDFGAGALGDMACHVMDGVFWALDPGAPTAIEPVTMTDMNKETFPRASVVKWEFPAKGKRRGLLAYWHDGGLKPAFPAGLEANRKYADNGNLFIGTKASLVISGAYGESPRIFPESKMKGIGKPKQLLERSPGQMEEWVMACKGEKPMDYARANFAYSGPFTEAILLGNIALRVGRRIEWDAKTMTITNLPEANQYITKEYREGWKF